MRYVRNVKTTLEALRLKSYGDYCCTLKMSIWDNIIQKTPLLPQFFKMQAHQQK